MGLDPSRIKVLCFDLDGTISDTDDLYVRKLARLAASLPARLSPRFPDKFARRWILFLESPGNLLLYWLDRLHLDNLFYQVRRLLSKPGAPAEKRHYLIIPGVLEALNKLHRHYPLVLVSAREGRSAAAFLDYFKLREIFDLIVTAETTRYTKPHPDPLLLVAQELGVLPEELLMIGDTTVDILAGKAAGTQTLGVLCGFGTQKELEKAGADKIVRSTAEVAGLFFPDSDIK